HLAAFHGLQEERVWTRAQAEVGGQRRVQVRRELGEHGHEVSLAREVAKLLAGRREGRDPYACGADAKLSGDALHGQRVQLLLELGPGHGTDHLVDDLAGLDEQDRRNRADAIATGQSVILVLHDLVSRYATRRHSAALTT